MRSISLNESQLVCGGAKDQSHENTFQYVKGSMDLIKNGAAFVYYTGAIASILAGGPFAGPATAGLVYYALWYNDTREPLGTVVTL